MALDREAIFAALFARLQANVPGIALFTRSPAEFTQAPDSKHPALLLLCHDEDAQRERGAPPVWTLTPSIHVYAKRSRVAPDIQLNTIETAIEAALERQPTDANLEKWQTTLGGLVQRCWVTGSARAAHHLNDEAELRIDLEILAVGP